MKHRIFEMRVGRPKKTILHDDKLLLKMASADNLSMHAIASNSRISKVLYTEELKFHSMLFTGE